MKIIYKFFRSQHRQSRRELLCHYPIDSRRVLLPSVLCRISAQHGIRGSFLVIATTLAGRSQKMRIKLGGAYMPRLTTVCVGGYLYVLPDAEGLRSLA